MRNLSVKSKQKLADQWEDTPYVVVRKIPDLPVYAVRPENEDRERVLHRNLLLPFNVIPPAQRNHTLAPKDSRNSHAPTTSSNVDLID